MLPPSRLRVQEACFPSHDHHASSTPEPIQSGSAMTWSRVSGCADCAWTVPMETAASGSRARQASRWRIVWIPLEKRSEEHTSELQSLMRISYAVFCLKKKTKEINTRTY